MQTFTKEELAKYNGKNGKPIYVAHNGKVYVAHDGKVYDVSKSPLWEEGEHQGMHTSGGDMTKDILDAPHEKDVLDRFPIVGELK